MLSSIGIYALIGFSYYNGYQQDEKRYFEIAYSNQGSILPYGYFVMNRWVKLGNDPYQKMALVRLGSLQHKQQAT